MAPTLTEIVTELEKRDVHAVVVEAQGTTASHCINVYATQNARFPFTSVWPPDKQVAAWVWGDNFEFGASDDADAASVAERIIASLPKDL